MKFIKLFAVAAGALALFGSFTASASPIVITPGNAGGNGGTDNVLFNDATKLHSGPLVQGNFSGAGDTGFVIDFTSASGTGLLSGSGGQATLAGGVGNDPFSDVTAKLENGVTFTNAILNINSNFDGNILFTVKYIMGVGSPFTLQQAVNMNGQNFFHIDAGMGALIQSIQVDGLAGVDFSSIDQWRIGGFNQPTNGVPDGGTTLMLLSTSMAGLGIARRFIKRQTAL